MKFPYRKLSLYPISPYFGSFILKPIIPVTLSANGRILRYAALIDSGADFCIFDAEIGGKSFTVKIGFSYDMAPHGFGILGQKGFFEIFRVAFDYTGEVIEIFER